MSFDHIQGHALAITLLQRLWRSERLAHAYIFHGPDGVGKFAAALELAGAALCATPGERGRCDQCADCRAVTGRAHPNLFVLEPPEDKHEISIKAVRHELWPWLSLCSVDGRDRWVIIRDAEAMTTEAANSVLKTLEEPPAGVRIVLVTATLQNLLPTVVSRCHRVRFGPLPDEVAADLLVRTRELALPQAKWLARFAGGSLGVATRLLAEGLQERWDWVRQRYRDLDAESLFPFAEEVAEYAKDAGGGEASRNRIRLVLDLMATFLRDALLLGAGAPIERLSAPDGAADTQSLLTRLSLADIITVLDQIQVAEGEIARNANQKLAVANLLLADGRIPR